MNTSVNNYHSVTTMGAVDSYLKYVFNMCNVNMYAVFS